MTKSPELEALLADEVTRAVLRADGVSMKDFTRTLDAAAERLARPLRHASVPAVRQPLPRRPAFSFACCGA